ncbi:hypothetical protein CH274_15240 [Rhodococcus sp. 06-418-5]|nr:hypothetical protein CH274_15240 [Rhodococcus sp. 06-418-5]
MRTQFDEDIEAYKSGGVLSLRGTAAMLSPSQWFEDATFAVCNAAESWFIAHELSHHLARDLSKRPDKQVWKAFNELLSDSSCWHQELARLAPSHHSEVKADLLAFLIVSGHFAPEKRRPMALPASLTGAAVALITIAHLRGEWETDLTDSHPGGLDRLRIFLTVVSELYGNSAVDPGNYDNAHMNIYRLSALLLTYGKWAKDGFPMNEVLEEDPATLYATLPHVFYMERAVDFGLLADAYSAKRTASNSRNL